MSYLCFTQIRWFRYTYTFLLTCLQSSLVTTSTTDKIICQVCEDFIRLIPVYPKCNKFVDDAWLYRRKNKREKETKRWRQEERRIIIGVWYECRHAPEHIEPSSKYLRHMCNSKKDKVTPSFVVQIRGITLSLLYIYIIKNKYQDWRYFL